jgi:hypothetical protein
VGLLDSLFAGPSQGGGLLDFLRNNAMNQQFSSGLPSDQAQYGSPMGAMAQAPMPAMPQQNAQPSPLDNAQWPYGPNGAPSQANAQMPSPSIQAAPAASAPSGVLAQGQPPQQPQALPPKLGSQAGGFFDGLNAGLQSIGNGGSIIGAFTGNRTDPQSAAQQNLKAQYDALVPLMGPQKALLAVMNPDAGKALFEGFKSKDPQNLGQGWVLPPGATKAVRLYEPDEKTPNSVREYEYYKENLPPGQQPMNYDLWSTAKARAGATAITNNVDMNSGQTYDKQLAEGLGKAHATLANGVEDAQTRARDIAAMQGAVDAIQKNGGTTGGLGQQQVLDLKKTINAGMTALGVDKPFNESDLSDKEFLTKFNRSMAGAQAKGAVGARVTNFEMSNFLKANPGLDMSVTGNQRLLGIQAQIEERNIAVGNSIRDATAEAISQGKKINPVTVQKIIKDYDDNHHIKDVVTGQDLTQSYALPEFQKGETNASMAKAHDENLKTMEKTIGGVTYEQRNGQWYPKQ